MIFNTLIVSNIKPLTAHSIEITFDIPDTLKNGYQFKAGQFITLSFDIDNQEYRRDYSLCAAPYENQIKIAVKAIKNGFISKKLVHDIKVGSSLKVSTPNGRFGINYKPNEKRTIVTFAGGSGITPILSIIKEILYQEKESSVYLFYSNSSEQNTMFLNELNQIQSNYPNFKWFNFLTQEKPKDNFYYGRLNDKKLDLIINQLLDWDEIDEVLICGPEEMIKELSNASLKRGIPKQNIHFELFTPLNTDIFEIENIHLISEVKIVHVEVDLYGDRFQVEWENDGTTLLDALLDAGIDAPYSCKGGVCSSCICKIDNGEVQIGENLILTDQDIKDKLTLSCVSLPKTDNITVIFE